MNESKCKALKTELSLAGEPKLVFIESFFDGNGDAGSIDCNLVDHPGIDVFREILTGLLRRSDVNAVFVRISALGPQVVTTFQSLLKERLYEYAV